MAEKTEKKLPAKFVPDMNRKEVADWSRRQSNSIAFDDFGWYGMAFKRWHFLGTESQQTFWLATCKILEVCPVDPPGLPAIPASKEGEEANVQVAPEVFAAALKRCRFNPTLPGFKNKKGKDRGLHTVGTEVEIFFPVGRKPLPNFPGLPEADDRDIKDFLSVICRIPNGQPTDWNALFTQLEEAGRIDHENMTFSCRVVPKAKRLEIVDPATQTVLKVSCEVNGKKYFDPWTPTVATAT